jgi:hypothetical protein
MTIKGHTSSTKVSSFAVVILFYLVLARSGLAAQNDFVRISKPEVLTFDELIELERNDTLPPNARGKTQLSAYHSDFQQ